MWLFTTCGFFSVVLGWDENKQPDRDAVMIRSRDDRHLEQLRDRFPALLAGVPVKSASETDYPFRMVVPFAVWKAIAAGLADDLDYRNFKSQAAAVQHQRSVAGKPADPEYPGVLSRIWGLVDKHYRSRRPG